MKPPFRIRFPVRFRDVDMMGHVNNSVYFTYMETARTELWIHLFGEDALRGSSSFIVAHAECDFKVAARLGDEVEVSIRTSDIRRSSFDWQYEIRSEATGDLFARGKTIQVFFNYETQKGEPVPPEIREKLLNP